MQYLQYSIPIKIGIIVVNVNEIEKNKKGIVKGGEQNKKLKMRWLKANKECLLRPWSATRQQQSARTMGNRFQFISFLFQNMHKNSLKDMKNITKLLKSGLLGFTKCCNRFKVKVVTQWCLHTEHAVLLHFRWLQFKGDLPSRLQDFRKTPNFFWNLSHPKIIQFQKSKKNSHPGQRSREKRGGWHRSSCTFCYLDILQSIKTVHI